MKNLHLGHWFISLPHTAECAVSHVTVRTLRNTLVLPAKMYVTHISHAHANQDFEIINQVGLHFETRKDSVS